MATVLGAGEIFADSPLVVAVPRVVEPRLLARANGLIASGQIVANEFIGPPLGAALFLLGAAVPLFTDAGTLTGAAMLVLSLPPLFATGPAAPTLRDTPWHALRAGLRTVWSIADLRRLTLAGGVVAAADAAWFSLLVLFVQDLLGHGPGLRRLVGRGSGRWSGSECTGGPPDVTAASGRGDGRDGSGYCAGAGHHRPDVLDNPGGHGAGGDQRGVSDSPEGRAT